MTVIAVSVTVAPLVMDVLLIVKSVPEVPTVPSMRSPAPPTIRPQPAVPVATAVPVLGVEVSRVAEPFAGALKPLIMMSTSFVPVAASFAAAGCEPV